MTALIFIAPEMKRYLIVILSLLFIMPVAFAQHKGNDRKKMNEEILNFKIEFLAKEMQLSEKEKADFAPLYKEFNDKRREVTHEARHAERELKKNKKATDADYKKLSELQKDAREKDSKVVAEYDEKFQKFLSAKQIYTMHQAEDKFMKKMEEMRRDGKKPHRK